MDQSIETPETELTEPEMATLAERHFNLVEKLKQALSISNAGFLQAGSTLLDIKSDKTYRGEDASRRVTWAEFCNRPDIQLPGRTPEARRRIADILIRVFSIFVETHQRKTEELTAIGWTKLEIVARKLEFERDPEVVEEWMNKAKTLSVNDLWSVLKHHGKDEDALIDCKHENEFLMWRCPDCGSSGTSPQCKEHKAWEAYVRKFKHNRRNQDGEITNEETNTEDGAEDGNDYTPAESIGKRPGNPGADDVSGAAGGFHPM